MCCSDINNNVNTQESPKYPYKSSKKKKTKYLSIKKKRAANRTLIIKERKEKKKRLLYLLSNLIGKIPQNKDNYRRQRYLWFGFFVELKNYCSPVLKGNELALLGLKPLSRARARAVWMDGKNVLEGST